MRRAAVGLALVAALSLGGCGGSDDDAASDTSETDSTGSAASTTSRSAPNGTSAATTTTAVIVTTPSATTVGGGFSPEPAEGSLRQGHSGPRVRALQTQLAALGYDVGRADGQFGPRTQAAVMAFQRDKSLTVDGVVGPQTAIALLAACEQQPACATG